MMQSITSAGGLFDADAPATIGGLSLRAADDFHTQVAAGFVPKGNGKAAGGKSKSGKLAGGKPGGKPGGKLGSKSFNQIGSSGKKGAEISNVDDLANTQEADAETPLQKARALVVSVTKQAQQMRTTAQALRCSTIGVQFVDTLLGDAHESSIC
jgi:hypothetical protein